MIQNYIKIAIRNLKRNKMISAINIFGLTFGLSITSLIVLYVQNELTYDTFHKDSENIYRLYSDIEFGKSRMSGPRVNAPMGPYLIAHYPKIITQTRVSGDKTFKFSIDDKLFDEEFIYVDPSFFQVFTFKFIYGNPQTALLEPFSVVLTEKIAKRFFGDVNPIGLVVKDENARLHKITAVIKNVPENSHLKFDILSPFSDQYSLFKGDNNIDGWGMDFDRFATYIKLTPDFSPKELSVEFPKIAETYLTGNPMFKHKISLHPLEKIYLEYYGGGDKSRIILFSVIGFFVLVIACINYMNLNTADAVKRLKEIGMRKVLGANRRQLICQLLFESTILSLLSLILALTLAEILLPLFNTILQKNLNFEYINNWPLTVSFIGLAIVTGFLAGSYPAFYLSALKPVNALKGKFVFGSGHAFFRNSLVIFQFAITIFLISCTGIIYMQIRHSNNADMGFIKEDILTLKLYPKNAGSVRKRTNAIGNTIMHIKNELSKFPNINDLSLASAFPFGGIAVDRYTVEEVEESQILVSYFVDENYTSFLGFKLIEGRDFSDQSALGKNNVLITETFVKQMGWDNPLGKTFTSNYDKTLDYKVVGIIKDFHQDSFRKRIYPAFVSYSEDPKQLRSLGIKVKSDGMQLVRAKIENLCKEFEMSFEVDLESLAQDVDSEYEEEYRTGKMFTNFAILAIIIAAMGLYGLALFMSRQRTKEIGVRKVFGGSVSEIIMILSRNFIKLILISALIGIPVAWYYMDRWLQSFVYQLENRWVVFVFATLLAIVIAFTTIFYQSYKAANSDPVDSIKYE